MRIAAVGSSTHKCVVCDEVVEKIDLIPWTIRQHQSYEDMDFPPIHAASLRRFDIRTLAIICFIFVFTSCITNLDHLAFSCD